MTTIQKFLFDISFDPDDAPDPRRRKKEAEQAAAPPPPPPPPTFSEEELARARQNAYAEGHAKGDAEGYERGRAEIEDSNQTAVADALVRLADGVEQLLADRDTLNAERTGQPARIALAVVEKLFPVTLGRHGAQELEEFVAACLAEAVDEARLTVRINDGLADELRPVIGELATQRGFAGRLVVMGDSALGPSDARIEWAEGGAERNTRQLLADIERAAERLLGMMAATDGETPGGHHG